MTISDYIIDFFIKNEIQDVFGYQGGMIAYLFDSMGRRSREITFHEFSNEQGASMAACGYTQATGKPSVVLTTSGPGFTNAVTGIAEAWYDSLPVLFIAGQVNTKDKKRELPIRQLGFQEIQTTLVVESITKKAFEIDEDTDIPFTLNCAWKKMLEGRKGPVFIDLPINICRNVIDMSASKIEVMSQGSPKDDIFKSIDGILTSKRPVIVAGAGINQCECRDLFRNFIDLLKVPVITTLPAVDLLPTDSIYKIGYQGGTARREAGIVLATTDCVLTLGTRLCAKSVGYDFPKYAPNAELYRVDIDENEFARKIKPNEQDICVDIRTYLSEAILYLAKTSEKADFTEWIQKCNHMKELLKNSDSTFCNEFIRNATFWFEKDANIVLDVGNNMIYGAQSSIIKDKTRLLVSGGLGAMGYSLPAAVGGYIGNGKITYMISGDGGMQMNIQELNIIGKRQLPIKMIVLNNRALGHILLFQKAYLNERYYGTDEKNADYYSCNFADIAKAYGIRGKTIFSVDELENEKEMLTDDKPVLFELIYEDCSMLPNIHGGKDCLSADPKLDEELIKKIEELGFEHLK